MNILAGKIKRIAARKADAFVGRLYPLTRTLDAMSVRPFELHLELTNLCNADCIFCPYQFQEGEVRFMSDEVFYKAVHDYVNCGGGGVGLTPIVGDALIDPKFLERVRYLRSLPQIDRIWFVTNAILLDKHGVKEVLESGLTSITISTAGFDEEMYKRVYRNQAYQRMRRNVLALVEENAKLAEPLNIALALRPDRPLKEVMHYPDFQPILAFEPELDFTWAYSTAQGKITDLPEVMKMRSVMKKKESCVSLYNGPIVLADGEVQACSCVVAMDAKDTLSIGHIQKASLLEIWKSEEMRRLRASFGTDGLNKTCVGCDVYTGLELYRTSEGRRRAEINLARERGETVKRGRASSPFAGG